MAYSGGDPIGLHCDLVDLELGDVTEDLCGREFGHVVARDTKLDLSLLELRDQLDQVGEAAHQAGHDKGVVGLEGLQRELQAVEVPAICSPVGIDVLGVDAERQSWCGRSRSSSPSSRDGDVVASGKVWWLGVAGLARP